MDTQKTYSVIKSDFDNIFDLDIVLKARCSAQYWRDLQERAKQKGIFAGCSVTPNGIPYFDTTKGKRYLLIDSDFN